MRAGPKVALAALALLLSGCAAPTNQTSPGSAEESSGAEDFTNANNEPDAGPGTPSDNNEQGESGPDASGLVRVYYVNVGQGDGTIWVLPDGSVIVYDCGPAAGSAAANPMNQQLRSLGVEPDAHIHALIASHGHLDHIGGCEEILADYYIDHLYDTWYEGSDAPNSYETFRNQVRAEGGILHNLLDDGGLTGDLQFAQWDLIPLTPDATEAGVTAQIIWPPSFQGDSWDEIAESSIAIRLSFGSTDLCFQGDIESAQESTIASYARDLNCEVYLVGHHGSQYASSSTWLAKMDPEYAVASFGENGYGHPTPQALCRIQAAGAAVYTTHRAGTITVETDGASISASPASPETIDYCAAGADYWSGAAAGAAAEQEPTQEPAPPPTPPSGTLTVTASVSDATPCQYTTVTIYLHVQDSAGAPVPSAVAETTWHYKSTTPTESATTDTNGDASVSRSISSATAGYTVSVDVDVTVGSASGSTQTSFTPVEC